MTQQFKVPVSQLTRVCSDDPFDFTSTADLPVLDTVIGQKRAIEAIDFGLNMESPGYHIYITGPEGTGKTTIIGDILSAHAQGLETPPDLCMVNNFDDPSSPRVMEMPTGSALFFARRMTRFLETLKVKLPKAFESEGFQERQAAVHKVFNTENQKIFSRMEAEAAQQGMGIAKTDQGFQPVPMDKDKPMSQEAFAALSKEEQSRIQEAMDRVLQLMGEAVKETRALAADQKKKLKEMAADLTGSVLAEEMDLEFSSFMDRAQVKTFLDEIRKDMTEHMALLLSPGVMGDERPERPETAPDPMALLARRYQVNVLMDRRGDKGAPVIFELNPTFQNLFGKIEKMPAAGGAVSDFTMVQAGSLLKADKGFLVLEVESLLRNPVVWETLKNTLQSGRLVIQDVPDQPGFFATSLKPDPIPVDLKVILLGGYEIFRAMQGADPKFNKIFKVRADFDHEVALTRETLLLYARFVARVCQTRQLRPFSACGVEAVAEFGSRLAGDRRRLSLRFGQILSLLTEADYWAGKEGADLIGDTHVFQALSAYRFRHNLYEEKVQDRYDDASILLDVTGEVVGQANALAVYQMGEIVFGRPFRITAESYMGKPGIINVEHEAQLSGQTYDKGVMIVAGYLGRVFAQNHPLSVSISITFEQSYAGIDGDSASSTELYAVLSSLSGYPVRQGIAVTGSVNQKGQIQAIGGVNEKIEGFFDVCIRKGLTGDQGVMIPAANVNNLMLRKDVVEAVDQGKFHIYQVSRIEEGIEILTGVPAGQADSQGNFPPDTVFGRAQARLKKFYDRTVQVCR